MDRQTLRDWVIRFNEQAADGLINIPSPGIPPKLNAIHKAFLARIVEEGPIAAIHGVVRWRACDLIMRLHGECGLSVSDDTIYRALKTLGFSHGSAPPSWKPPAHPHKAHSQLPRRPPPGSRIWREMTCRERIRWLNRCAPFWKPRSRLLGRCPPGHGAR